MQTPIEEDGGAGDDARDRITWQYEDTKVNLTPCK